MGGNVGLSGGEWGGAFWLKFFLLPPRMGWSFGWSGGEWNSTNLGGTSDLKSAAGENFEVLKSISIDSTIENTH